MDIAIRDWFEQRSFRWQDFSQLASPGGTSQPTVSLVLPAREVAGTIGPILDTVARLTERSGLIDQVLVIDADSADGTADIARACGAEVYSENELLPDLRDARPAADPPASPVQQGRLPAPLQQRHADCDRWRRLGN